MIHGDEYIHQNVHGVIRGKAHQNDSADPLAIHGKAPYLKQIKGVAYMYTTREFDLLIIPAKEN